jgi:hypothetical protein
MPILGHVVDTELHEIRPIVGILGSAMVQAPLDLGVAVSDAQFLPDHKYAIVASPETAEALVVDLEDPGHSVPIAGASSAVSRIRLSRDGTKAALYYSKDNRLLVISGLPTAPVLTNSIDISMEGSVLRSFAIADDGVALLAFHTEDSDRVYIWTSGGLRFVTTASSLSDMAFMDQDAVIADVGSDQVFLIRSVRDQASPALIAGPTDGISGPAALSVSRRNEIYVGGGQDVLVFDATGHLLRKTSCACTITTLTPIGEFGLRLTSPLHDPLMVLDSAPTPARILFVPALPMDAELVP